MSRRVATTIPGARLHVVAGGGHFPNRTHRREVQDAIGRFLVESVGRWPGGMLEGTPDSGGHTSPEGKTNVSAPDLFKLEGSVALVVGGGGLGRAMARGLAEAGAAVAVADVAKDRAAVVADAVAGSGGRALALEVEVTSGASVERMTEEAEQVLGPIDVLVNSAGITRRAPAAEFAEADWQRVIAVNLTGVFLACQAVGRRMLARRTGRIINIASIAGEIGLAGTVAYAASKGGVVNLTRALAVEWAPHGVRVNAIAPSWFDTDMGGLIRAEPAYAERAMRRVPMGRMGRPDELIGTVVYLASEASGMVTGHILAVDGGTLAS
jgi:NAD(P)-dependent dehydrogenase (short-subunit alcohol dehydrogenase family)